jgi:hypothetical protein
VGDAAHHPFAEPDVLALLSGWLADEETVAVVREVARGLPEAGDVGPLLRRLAG